MSKKSISNNDNIAFLHHLQEMMKHLPANCSMNVIEAATEAWRMIVVATKFKWSEYQKECARRAILKFRNIYDFKDFYSFVCMGDFLNDIHAAFTGKAILEA